jgi:2-methylisocitrate lyase-like PEP mutase family enzyme
MANTAEQLRAIAERLGGPLMYLAGRGGLAGLGLTLAELGALGYKIVADPSTPLLAAYAAWKKAYAELADDFGSRLAAKPDWAPVEKDMLAVIDIEKLLAVERATVERGHE